VVDFRVNVVGSSRQDDAFFAGFFKQGENFLAFSSHVGFEPLVLGVGFFECVADFNAADIQHGELFN
jgi:hypothetical protein